MSKGFEEWWEPQKWVARYAYNVESKTNNTEGQAAAAIRAEKGVEVWISKS